jgi:hypothetical protein
MFDSLVQSGQIVALAEFIRFHTKQRKQQNDLLQLQAAII